MLDFKKIFSPRNFLTTLETGRFSWELAIANFVALFLSIVISSLTFASFRSVFAARSFFTPSTILTLIVLISFPLLRFLVVRFVGALITSYFLTEYSPHIKRAGIGMWRLVNTYFYALFLVTCTQIAFFILGGLIATVYTPPLFVLGWIYSHFFDVAVILVAAQWVFKDVRGQSMPVKNDRVMEGEVIDKQEVK